MSKRRSLTVKRSVEIVVARSVAFVSRRPVERSQASRSGTASRPEAEVVVTVWVGGHPPPVRLARWG
jgi:hypothetical protein